MTVDVRIVRHGDGRWYSPVTGTFYPEGPTPPPVGLGATIYTDAEIETWTTGTEYTALAARLTSPRGTITDYGTTIVMADMANLQTVAEDAKCYAALWKGGGEANATWLGYVTDTLNGIKDVTSWTGTTGQVNLEGSWILCNLVQAAQIIGYSNVDFEAFLRRFYRSTVYPSTSFGLDWAENPNWQLAAAVARMLIASYLQDAELWADAVDYFQWHIARSIVHPTHDTTIKTLPQTTTWPARKTATPAYNADRMAGHWDFEFVHEDPTGVWPLEWSNHNPGSGSWTYAGDMTAGMHGEAKRTLNYEYLNAHLAAMGGLIARNVGYTLTTETTDKIEAIIEFSSDRILGYANTSTLPTNPTPRSVSPPAAGDNQKYRGWFTIARYYEPADVTSLLVHSAVTSLSQKEGDLVMTACEYADGTLL